MKNPLEPERSAFQRLVVRWSVAVFIIAVFAGGWSAVERYRHDAPRRQALGAIREMRAALDSLDPATALKGAQLPAPIAEKPVAEQARWLREMLADEISADGLAALARGARFGPLLDLFPEDGPRWAATVKVPPGECVAFRMEREGIRAEVVLHQAPAGHRVIRCNNVKQMAPTALTKS